MEKNNNPGIGEILLFLLLPPVWGFPISISLWKKHRNDAYAAIVIALFAVLLSYLFFSIDNVGRIRSIEQFYSLASWGDKGLAQLILSTGVLKLGMESLHILTFYFFLEYYFLYKVFNKILESETAFLHLFILVFCSLSIRFTIDLLYYSLAIITCMYVMICMPNKIIVRVPLAIVLAYFIHPGALMVSLPAIVLSIAMRSNSRMLYFIALISVFLYGFLFSKLNISFLGIDSLNHVSEKLTSYTGSNNYWGVRETKLSGITYTIMFFIIPAFYFIIMLLQLNRFGEKTMGYDIALFQAAALLYPSNIHFVTITERIMVCMSLGAIFGLIWLVKLDKYKIRSSQIVIFTAFVFLFMMWKGSMAIYPKNVFIPGSYRNVQIRTTYIPTILLFDYKDFGYSDNFVLKNQYVW